jgi:hypothetical protein
MEYVYDGGGVRDVNTRAKGSRRSRTKNLEYEELLSEVESNKLIHFFLQVFMEFDSPFLHSH